VADAQWSSFLYFHVFVLSTWVTEMAHLYDNTDTEYAQTDSMDVGWERNLHEANEL